MVAQKRKHEHEQQLNLLAGQDVKRLVSALQVLEVQGVVVFGRGGRTAQLERQGLPICGGEANKMRVCVRASIRATSCTRPMPLFPGMQTRAHAKTGRALAVSARLSLTFSLLPNFLTALLRAGRSSLCAGEDPTMGAGVGVSASSGIGSGSASDVSMLVLVVAVASCC